jgi:predicted Zn finger-like uncharacterized protein
VIVTCAKCATQFQLDEARVPEVGIRVRCSICKHSFFVEHPEHPGRPPEDAIERAVQEALAADAAGPPEITYDLGRPDAVAAAEDREGGAPEPWEEGCPEPWEEGRRPEPGEEARPEPWQESWEFSDGGRLSEATARGARDRFAESFHAARQAVDDLLGSSWPGREEAPSRGREEAPVGAGAEAQAGDPEAALDADRPRSVPGADRSEAVRNADPAESVLDDGPEDRVPLASDPWATPGSVEGARAEPPRGEETEGRGDPLRAGGAESPALDLDTAFASGLVDALESGGGDLEEDLEGLDQDLAGPQGEELETPEDWALPGEGSGLELVAPQAGRGTHGLAAESPPIGLGLPLELAPPGHRATAWLERVGHALGWAVVAVLAGVAFGAGLLPRSTPRAAPGSQALAGLEATGVAGRWVENAVLGPLYVVSGELHNPGPEAKAPGARLVVRLLDGRGAPVREAAATLAPPVGTLRLREAHPRELRAGREEGALRLARTPIAPGARVPFEAIVVEMPDAARRFELAAIPLGAPEPAGS